MLILHGYINADFPVGSEGPSLKSGLTIGILSCSDCRGKILVIFI